MKKILVIIILILCTTSSYADITTGLIGLWKFDENTSGTCSGASIVDSSGNGYTGTCGSSPTWVVGKIGAGAINLSPANANVTFSGLTSTISAPYSVACWMYLNSSVSGANYSLWNTRTPSEHGTDLAINYPTVGLHGDIGSGSGWINTSADISYTFSTSTWYHIVATYSATTYTYYVDGSSIGSGSIGGTGLLIDTTHTLVTGFSTGIGSLPGHVDDLRVYTRVLSPSDVTQLYNYTGQNNGYFLFKKAQLRGLTVN